jgi:hypothetical protein
MQLREFFTVAGMFGTKVTVKRQVLARASDHACVYDPTKRTLFIFTGDANLPANRWQEPLVIHEAVHVAGHMHKRNVTAVSEEMAAHVAQGMFLVLYQSQASPAVTGQRAARATPQLVRACVRKSDACSDARLIAATAIAAELLNKQTPTQGMLKALQTGLEKDPAYRRVLARPLAYGSGIP